MLGNEELLPYKYISGQSKTSEQLQHYRAQSSTFFVLRLISFPMKLEKNRSEFMPDGGSGFFLD